MELQLDAVPRRPLRLHPLPDARRAEPTRLAHEIEIVGRSSVVAALLEAVDATLLILNPQRQIVSMNAPGDQARELVGLRPGEALGCAKAAPSGCGTSPACQLCGALGAILGCQESGRAFDSEFALTSARPGADRDFAIRATPVRVDGNTFTVVSLRDVTVEKRCERLEQVFFHDLLNTVTVLRGWSWRLGRPEISREQAAARIDLLSRWLELEIADHRALVRAERGELVPSPERIRPAALLRDLELLFAGHDTARDRRFEVVAGCPDAELETDPALLTRVLVNMVLNALEASAPGGTVRLACELAAGEGPGGRALRFTVRNQGHIPPEVQPRIFQRSFSTKARHGRGFGTYGMKLLGERHLGGAVSFSSSPEAGTVFELRLPARA
jgi:hypothetical protein